METRLEMDEEIQPRQASEWLAALLERPDDAGLRERFDAWLLADPANAADWAEIAWTYEVMGQAPAAHRDQWASYAARHAGARRLPEVVIAVDAVPESVIGHAAWPVWVRRAAAGLAAAAVAACLILVAAPQIQLRLTADHVTATAEIRTVHLADGSSVQLGPESAIDVAYAGDGRSVQLLQGEAFFEVAPDPGRPFRVRAGFVEATVLGTAFEVRLDDGAAEVAVRHGVVRVDSDKDTTSAGARLEAGDWFRMAQAGQVTRGELPPEQVAAWQHGRLIAKDRPVGEVVDQLRRYYRGVVVLRGSDLARQPLTGVYNLSDPVAALKAVAEAQGATAYELSPWVLVISGG
jgi:transmembrane sensor